MGEKIYPYVKENIRLHLQPDETTIYQGDRPWVERINLVGAEILELCDGKISIDEICRIFSQKYKDEIAKVKSLILPFLEEAEKKEYIEFFDLPVERERRDRYISGSTSYWVPLVTSLELTTKCNLNCIHCYAKRESINRLEISTKKWLKILENLSNIGVVQLFLTGGEALIHIGFSKIIEFCRGKFLAIEVASNGYEVTPQIIELFASFSNLSLQVSIDGIEETHNYIRGKQDAFEKTIRNISLMAEKGIPIMVTMTVNPLNVDQIEKVINIAKESGAKGFKVGLTLPIGNAKKSLEEIPVKKLQEINDEYEKMGAKYQTESFQLAGWRGGDVELEVKSYEKKIKNCAAGYNIWHILSDGTVLPCATLEIPLGNVITESIEKICSSSKIKFFTELYFPNENICNGCNDFYYCQACSAVGYITSKRNSDCQWIKQFERFPVLSKALYRHSNL